MSLFTARVENSKAKFDQNGQTRGSLHNNNHNVQKKNKKERRMALQNTHGCCML